MRSERFANRKSMDNSFFSFAKKNMKDTTFSQSIWCLIFYEYYFQMKIKKPIFIYFIASNDMLTVSGWYWSKYITKKFTPWTVWIDSSFEIFAIVVENCSSHFPKEMVLSPLACMDLSGKFYCSNCACWLYDWNIWCAHHSKLTVDWVTKRMNAIESIPL